LFGYGRLLKICRGGLILKKNETKLLDPHPEKSQIIKNLEKKPPNKKAHYYIFFINNA